MFGFLFPLSLTFLLSLAQPDLKSNLVADHSRKTFRGENNDDNTISLLLDEVPVLDKGKVSDSVKNFGTAFAQSARESLEHSQDVNYFKQFWYDPTYKIHDLCEPHRSGQQSNNLIWTESGDKLLRVIGNGVVKDGYNMFMAPGQGRGLRTDVFVAIYIESMSSFKAQTMDFEVDMYLAMGWFDRRLAHNCTYPILVTNKLIADRIWHPDLYFVNSKFAYLQEVTTPNFMVIVYPDGLIFKSMRLDVTLSCMMNLKMFPMDYQECPITIQSYAYIEQIVNLTWHYEDPFFPIGSNQDILLNDMEIVGSRAEKCAGPYPMFRGSADWSCIKAYIMMKRLVLFHIIQTYIPTGMLVSISWMSFWLDPRASPARVSLTITSLLTLTTMSNGARQDLPQVSYIKALDVWLTVSQALIFLVLLEYSFVSYFTTKRVFHCAHRKSYQHHKMSTPNGGIHDEEKGKDETTEMYPFQRASPTPTRTSSEKKKNFSLSSGLTACMSHTAALCGTALLAEKIALTRDWLETECENSALMSATPHAAAHIYSKYDFTKPCQKCAYENEKTARKIDRCASGKDKIRKILDSRAVFPTVFATFTIVYWLYYSWRTEVEKASKAA